MRRLTRADLEFAVCAVVIVGLMVVFVLGFVAVLYALLTLVSA